MGQAHRSRRLLIAGPTRFGAGSRLGNTVVLVSLLLLFGASCTSTPPRPQLSGATGQFSTDPQRSRVVEIASAQIGTPYRFGGGSPKGFDCSGLVQFAHAGAGVDVPRTTVDQWRQGRPVSRRQLMPGDLLFFELGWRKSRHVGVYIGGDDFVHAPSSGKRVGYASLDNPYWNTHFAGARSFLPAF